MQWNILIIDDDVEIAKTVDELISGNKIVEAPDTIVCSQLTSFEKAIEMMQINRYDIIILDLKDDEIDAGALDDKVLSGERVMNILRKSHFTPVIFHSGFANKVMHLKSPFVRVVTKDDPKMLRQEITTILETKLPQLVRHIEEQQRSYLWDHIENNWKDDEKICEETDLAYLVAKRLSNALGTDSIRKFFDSTEENSLIRPVEMYIWPPLNDRISFGDILKSYENNEYYVVLTPACDCFQGKSEKALLVTCSSIENQDEYLAALDDRNNNRDISNTKKKEFMSLIKDRRSKSGFQPERYKFLPKTTFLPDLVIDLQRLSQVAFLDLVDSDKFKRVATLDSPFAEALQNRFTQYYGRIGTPDLHAQLVYDRIFT